VAPALLATASGEVSPRGKVDVAAARRPGLGRGDRVSESSRALLRGNDADAENVGVGIRVGDDVAPGGGGCLGEGGCNRAADEDNGATLPMDEEDVDGVGREAFAEAGAGCRLTWGLGGALLGAASAGTPTSAIRAGLSGPAAGVTVFLAGATVSLTGAEDCLVTATRAAVGAEDALAGAVVESLAGAENCLVGGANSLAGADFCGTAVPVGTTKVSPLASSLSASASSASGRSESSIFCLLLSRRA